MNRMTKIHDDEELVVMTRHQTPDGEKFERATVEETREAATLAHTLEALAVPTVPPPALGTQVGTMLLGPFPLGLGEHMLRTACEENVVTRFTCTEPRGFEGAAFAWILMGEQDGWQTPEARSFFGTAFMEHVRDRVTHALACEHHRTDPKLDELRAQAAQVDRVQRFIGARSR